MKRQAATPWRWRAWPRTVSSGGGPADPGSAAGRADDLRCQGPRHQLPSDRAVAAPPGAPNVLVVLLDDVGFGASSAFGGPVHMPTAERLAGEGLKYTRFHTTALCSPTRAALLSGRNHHAAGMGGITEQATSAPATARSARTRSRRWSRSCGSTGTRPGSSASAMRCPLGRPARRGRSTAGRPAAASSTSTGSSPARPTSGTRPCTRTSPRSNRGGPPSRATT
jgi:Sulfatase